MLNSQPDYRNNLTLLRLSLQEGTTSRQDESKPITGYCRGHITVTVLTTTTGFRPQQRRTIRNSNAYFVIGLQGQYLNVDPVTATVVVKLSYFPPGNNMVLDAEVMAFMSAASALDHR